MLRGSAPCPLTFSPFPPALCFRPRPEGVADCPLPSALITDLKVLPYRSARWSPADSNPKGSSEDGPSGS